MHVGTYMESSYQLDKNRCQPRATVWPFLSDRMHFRQHIRHFQYLIRSSTSLLVSILKWHVVATSLPLLEQGLEEGSLRYVFNLHVQTGGEDAFGGQKPCCPILRRGLERLITILRYAQASDGLFLRYFRQSSSNLGSISRLYWVGCCHRTNSSRLCRHHRHRAMMKG